MHYSVVAALFISSFVNLATSQSIDPKTVDKTTREKWCNDQKAACPLICLQLPNTTAATEANGCDPDTLVYSCICSDGQSPNASQYSQTIPYYECTTAGTQCVNNCASGDTSCQSACRSDHPCGAQSPTPVNTSTMSTMASTSAPSTSDGASATTTGGGSTAYTGFGGAATTTAGAAGTNGAQALAIGFGRVYGLALTLTTLCAAFAFML